jgi:hypothetical protein
VVTRLISARSSPEKKQESKSRNAERENQSVGVEWRGIDVNSFDEMEHHLEEKCIEDETKKSDSILESRRIERERRNAEG